MKKILLLFLLFGLPFITFSQAAFQRSVLLEVSVTNEPASIQLSWNKYADATNYVINRRAKNAISWGTPIKTLTATDSSFTDLNVQRGKAYEYRVVRNGTPYVAYGYIYAGIEFPNDAFKGKVIVLVDSILTPTLNSEIAQYLNDLRGEGWIPIYKEIPQNMDVQAVKKVITDFYTLDPTRTRSLFLLGHIPVPYSGDLNPDGHPDHLGAWPADAYYAEMNGVWQDNTVNDVVASDPRNRNIPDDGKFDQTIIPGPVELEVGRVDFHNLPAFPANEIELTRKYLVKDHAFRTKQFTAQSRGLIQDNFGGFAEGFSQNGYKNFSTMFGINKVDLKEYRATLQNESYMWSYGCGGGNYVSSSGINSTTNLVTDSLQTVFTMLFGSYFGDWDSQNNFLRSALASGQTLTNAWAARPNWQFHHMALGESVGYAAKLTMNNNTNGYDSGYGAVYVHIALMGDPTLYQYPAKPMENLVVAENQGNILLSWDAFSDDYDHYELFKRYADDEPFVLVKSLAKSTLNYTDSCAVKDKFVEYCIRASVLSTSASGTFFILNKGAINSIVPTTESPAIVNVSYNIKNENVSFTTTGNAKSYNWKFGDGSTSNLASPAHVYTKSGTYTVILTTTFDCQTKMDTLVISVILTNSNALQNVNNFKVYPSITNTFLTIEGIFSNNLDFSIISMNGMIVKKAKLIGEKTIINVSDLAPGLYELRTIDTAHKFVIQR